MALDPSIFYASGRGITPLMSQPEMQQQVNQAGNGMLRNQLMGQQVQEGRQSMADAMAMRQLAQESGGNSDLYDAGLAKMGTPIALETQQKRALMQKQIAQAEAAQAKAVKDISAQDAAEKAKEIEDKTEALRWAKGQGINAPRALAYVLSHAEFKGPQFDEIRNSPYDPMKLDYLIETGTSMKTKLALKASERKDDAPQSSIAKLESDYRNGRIDKSTYESMKRKETYIAPQMGSMSGASGGGDDPQAYAQRLVKGLEDWPSAVSIRTDPVIREGLTIARQLDPEFNSATHKQRAKMVKAFTSGPEAQTLNKINTALSHLSEYSDLLEKVPDVGFGPANNLVNSVRGKFGNTDINSANTTQTTLSNELEGAYRQGGGTEAGIQHMRELLDPNLPLAARRANLATVTSLLKGKQDAMVDQYNKGMGKFGAPLEVLSPQSQADQAKVLARGGVKPKVTAPSAPVASSRPTATLADGSKVQLSADGKSWEPMK